MLPIKAEPLAELFGGPLELSEARKGGSLSAAYLDSASCLVSRHYVVDLDAIRS